MATLPTPDDVGQLQDSPLRRMGIGGWNPRVIGQDTQEAGRGFENLGTDLSRGLDEETARQNNLQAAQVTGANTAAATTALSALPSMTDPTAIANAKAGVLQTVNDNLSGITDPQTRAMVTAHEQERLAQVGAHFDGRVREVQNQGALAGLETNAISTIGSAASMPEGPAQSQALDGINLSIDHAVNAGIITAPEGVQRKQQYAQQFIETRARNLWAQVQAQPPGQRDYTGLAKFLGVDPAAWAAAGGAAAGATGYGATNAPYTKPLDQPGEGGIVSPSQHYQYLISQGATPNEALMLTGAAANESSFNPGAVHDPVNGVPTGHGLYGHKDDRLNMTGLNWEQQATKALQELKSRPEDGMVNSAQSPEQLALAEMHYEQPRGYSPQNPAGGDNFTGRLNTLRYFSRLSGGAIAEAAGSPSATTQASALGIPQIAGPGSSPALGQGGTEAPPSTAPGLPIMAAAYAPGQSSPFVGIPPAGSETSPAATSAALGLPPAAPPSSQWPPGTQAVLQNGDGSLSYQMKDGSLQPVPGSRATGAPAPGLPPLPKGSLLSFLPPAQQAEQRLSGIREIQRLQREDQIVTTKDNRADLASIDTTVNGMVKGVIPDETAWSTVMNTFGNSVNPQTRAEVAQADAVRNNLLPLQGKPPAYVAGVVGAWQADLAQREKTNPLDPFNPMLSAVVQAGQKYSDLLAQQVKKDPYGRAEMDGVINNVALDPNSPDFAAAVAKRVQDQAAVAEHFGVDVPFIRSQERTAMRAAFHDGGQPLINAVTGIVQGGGTEAPQIFKQLGVDAPGLMAMGQLALDPNQDHSTVVNRIASYLGAMNDKEGAKGLVKIGGKDLLRTGLEDPYADAFGAMGVDEVARRRENAGLLASEDATSQNIDPKVDITALSPDLIKKAYNEAAGATYDDKQNQWGGIGNVSNGGIFRTGPSKAYNVLAPTDVRADKIGDVFGSLTDSDISRMPSVPFSPERNAPITAAQLRGATFHAVLNAKTGLFDGQYTATIPSPTGEGEEAIRDKSGKSWVLDLGLLGQDPGFRGRIPDAYTPKLSAPPPQRYQKTPGVTGEETASAAEPVAEGTE